MFQLELGCLWVSMHIESNDQERNKLLLTYSDTQERASINDPIGIPDLVPEIDIYEPEISASIQSQDKTYRKGLRFYKDLVLIHIIGYPGIQSIKSSKLVRCFSLVQLRIAAKRYLKRTGVKQTRRKTNKRKASQKSPQNEKCSRPKEEAVNDKPAI